MDGTFNPHHDHNNCCSLWNPSVVIVCSNGFVWNLIIWNIKGKSFEFLRHTFFFSVLVSVFLFIIILFILCSMWMHEHKFYGLYGTMGNFFPCHCWGHSRVIFESLWNFSHTKRWIEIFFLCNGKFQSIFTIKMQLSFILYVVCFVFAVNHTIKHSL